MLPPVLVSSKLRCLLGISTATEKRWEQQGKLRPVRIAALRRYIVADQPEEVRRVLTATADAA